jgi:hypothetical protein
MEMSNQVCNREWGGNLLQGWRPKTAYAKISAVGSDDSAVPHLGIYQERPGKDAEKGTLTLLVVAM